MISNFLFNFFNFCIIVSFFDKIANIWYFIFKAVNAVNAKPLVLSISVLTSFTFVLRTVLVAKFVISSILSSIFLILALYSVFLTTSFLLHYLVYLNQREQVVIYQYLIYLPYYLNCLNYSVNFLIYRYLIYQLQFIN